MQKSQKATPVPSRLGKVDYLAFRILERQFEGGEVPLLAQLVGFFRRGLRLLRKRRLL